MLNFTQTLVCRRCAHCGPEGTKCAEGLRTGPKLKPDDCFPFRAIELRMEDVMAVSSMDGVDMTGR